MKRKTKKDLSKIIIMIEILIGYLGFSVVIQGSTFPNFYRDFLTFPFIGFLNSIR